MSFWSPRHLGGQMVLAFLGVALLAEAVFASVTLLNERSDFAALAASQRSNTASAVESALVNAYRAAGGWRTAELEPALALVGVAGAAVSVTAPKGTVVASDGPSSLFSSGRAFQVRRPLMVGGSVVGRLRIAFPNPAVGSADARLRAALARSVAISAALAALVAIMVAFVAARSLLRPIRRLSAAARALGSGASRTRVGTGLRPAELAELAGSFDSMAASLERHEQLRRAMVSDIAHELRTPLAILQGETEALVDGVSLPTPQAMFSLHEEVLRLHRMVDDLSTLASADAAGLRLDRTSTDLAEISAKAAATVERRFETSGVRLVLEVSPAPIWADPNRLSQVVMNLLFNAYKFTPAGGFVSLEVGHDTRRAYLRVTDTGPGVPADERELVFERFFRGSTGQKVSGSGIGLAIVKELVKAHGGHVTVEDAAGGGACFTVSLPLVTRRVVGPKRPEDATGSTASSLRPHHLSIAGADNAEASAVANSRLA